MAELDAATKPEVGLCSICRHARTRRGRHAHTFWQCGEAERDSRLLRYPPLPVERCPAFVRGEPGGA